ncbi:AraC family transcriptional regulator [Vallitalea okinawensis]|uniref:AraC family transcriptional regulator n=1 Tax=Vallitalea okinawensis TaxID=2078660 RepID=UPI001A9A5B03|nr:AraC family transcriptional regulator [Vallitalea okinawensis]
MHDIAKASRKLSQLDLKFKMDSFDIEMYWFRVMAIENDWKIGRHTHSTYEFHFVAEGESIVRTDQHEFTIKKNQFYITRPGEYHEQLNIDGKKYVEYSMNCAITLNNDTDIEQTIVNERLKKAVCKPFDDNNGILDLFEKVLICAYEEKIGFYSAIKHYILLILLSTVQVINEDMTISYKVPLKHKKGDYRFKQIKQYVEDNVHSPIITKDIATFMYLSDKQVSRIIKKETGISTKQYINKIKLKRAKELLKNSDQSIKEISEMLGFSSEYYFNQFFKREEGYPPGVFRINTVDV